MAAVAVLPPKQPQGGAMEVDQVASSSSTAADEDLYTRLKTLQRQLEFLEIQVSAAGGCRLRQGVARPRATRAAAVAGGGGCRASTH